MAHMCGACLSIRDDLGYSARPALNRDALVLSMLVEQLSTDNGLERTNAGRCPLRGMRRAAVVDPGSVAARYAGLVSVVLLRAGVRDHIEDRDRHHLMTRLIAPLAETHGEKALSISSRLGVDLARIESCVHDEREARSRPGLGLAEYLRYTEEAFAVGFTGVAALVPTPAAETAVGSLDRLGRAYGATAAMVDACEDYDDDARRRQFNLLVASWPAETKPARFGYARQELQAYAARIEEALTELAVRPGELLWSLLVTSLGQRVNAAVALGAGVPVLAGGVHPRGLAFSVAPRQHLVGRLGPGAACCLAEACCDETTDGDGCCDCADCC